MCGKEKTCEESQGHVVEVEDVGIIVCAAVSCTQEHLWTQQIKTILFKQLYLFFHHDFIRKRSEKSGNACVFKKNPKLNVTIFIQNDVSQQMSWKKNFQLFKQVISSNNSLYFVNHGKENLYFTVL